MSGSQDFYSALGLEPGAKDHDIRKAFRHLALKLHPDKNLNDAEATQRFQRLSQCYDVLGDPEKRRLYDLRLGHRYSDGQDTYATFPSDNGTSFEAFFFPYRREAKHWRQKDAGGEDDEDSLINDSDLEAEGFIFPDDDSLQTTSSLDDDHSNSTSSSSDDDDDDCMNESDDSETFSEKRGNSAGDPTSTSQNASASQQRMPSNSRFRSWPVSRDVNSSAFSSNYASEDCSSVYSLQLGQPPFMHDERRPSCMNSFSSGSTTSSSSSDSNYNVSPHHEPSSKSPESGHEAYGGELPSGRPPFAGSRSSGGIGNNNNNNYHYHYSSNNNNYNNNTNYTSGGISSSFNNYTSYPIGQARRTEVYGRGRSSQTTAMLQSSRGNQHSRPAPRGAAGGARQRGGRGHSAAAVAGGEQQRGGEAGSTQTTTRTTSGGSRGATHIPTAGTRGMPNSRNKVKVAQVAGRGR